MGVATFLARLTALQGVFASGGDGGAGVQLGGNAAEDFRLEP